MCLNPAFAAFALFVPRDAQNRNKIKLSRTILFFQSTINGFQFNRSTIKYCHSGLAQTGFYILPIPSRSKSLTIRSEGGMSLTEEAFSPGFEKMQCKLQCTRDGDISQPHRTHEYLNGFFFNLLFYRNSHNFLLFSPIWNRRNFELFPKG